MRISTAQVKLGVLTALMMTFISFSAFGQIIPLNDDCANALKVYVGDIDFGTTTNATADAVPFCGVAVQAPGVWYTIQGHGDTLVADLCTFGALYNARINVYSGSCGSLVCVTGDDNTCGPNNYPRATWLSQMCETYYVLIQGTNGETGDFIITFQSPTPSLIANPGPNVEICEFQTYQLPGSASGAFPPFSYSWSPTTNLSNASIANPIFTPPSPGTYTYTLTVTDDEGCTDANPVTITVHPLPVVSFTGLNPEYCVDDMPTQLTPSPMGGAFSGTGVVFSAVDTTIVGSANAVSFAALGLPLPVPPSGTGGFGSDTTVSTITVSGAGGQIGTTATLSSIDIEISHTWNSDLVVRLVAPNGTNIELWSNIGGSSDGFNVTIDDNAALTMASAPAGFPITGTYRIESGLLMNTLFTGSAVDGNWTIRINDVAGGDLGALNHWQLNFLTPDTVLTPVVGQADAAVFDPAVAGVGTHWVYYTYTDSNSCTNVDSQMTIVHPLPVVSFSGLDPEYCLNDMPALLTGNHAGGTFTGSGITDNMDGTATFSPGVAGVGVHNITYSYTDANGCTDSETQSTEVLMLPVVSFTGLNPTPYCIDNQTYPLTGSPVGGVFSGPGVTDLGGGMGEWDPAAAGYVGFYEIVYTYTDTNGCTNADTQTAEIIATGNDLCTDAILVQVGQTISGTTECATIDVAPFCVVGIDAPGVWYRIMGTGGNITVDLCNIPGTTYDTRLNIYSGDCNNLVCVTGNDDGPACGFAYPSTVTWASSPCVEYFILVQGFNNLVGDFVMDITGNVQSLNAHAGPDRAICEDATTSLGGSPTATGGNAPYTYNWSPATDLNNAAIANPVFTPSAPGIYTYTVLVTDNTNCTAEDEVIVTVNELPSPVIVGLASSYCVDDELVVISGDPTGGTFSGPGLVALPFGGAVSSYSFTAVPQAIPDGDPVGISISQTIATSGTALGTDITLDSVSIVVSHAWVGDLIIDLENPAGTAVRLIDRPGVPASTFGCSGDNIVATFTLGTGNSAENVCNTTFGSNAIEGVFTAHDGFDLNSLNNGTSPNGAWEITAADPEAFGAGSVQSVTLHFSGPGTGFDPTSLAPGTYTITYTYTDGNGCTNSVDQDVTINDLPVVSFTGLDPTYCFNEEPATLTGNPAGGVFFGPGIENDFTSSVSYQVGTGTLSNSIFTYPAPFGNWFFGAKHQFLVRANELIASGAQEGFLTSVAFNVTNTNGSPPHQGFRVALGTTTATSLTAHATGLTEVKAPATETPVPGWNTIGFDQAFYWDGVSNLIVEVCFNNPSFTVNASTQYSDVGYTATRYYIADNTTVCAQNTNSSSNFRPNMQFGFAAGFTGVADFTPADAGPGSHTITYVFTDSNGCSNSASQTTFVYDQIFVDAGVDATICENETIELGGAPTASGGTGGYTYSWAPTAGLDNAAASNPVFTPAMSTTIEFTVTVTDSVGCMETDVVEIFVDTIPTVTMSGIDTFYCLNYGCDTLTGFPPGGTFAGPGVIIDTTSGGGGGGGCNSFNLDIGNQVSIFSSTLTRGYSFQAPVDFTITSLMVPNTVTPGPQCIQVVLLSGPPSVWPTVNSPFTTLFYTNSAAFGTPVSVNIPVSAGNWIGVLGASNPSGTTMSNSYGPNGPYNINIGGQPASLSRFLYQGSISGAPAPSPNTTTEIGFSIGRIEMEYEICGSGGGSGGGGGAGVSGPCSFIGPSNNFQNGRGITIGNNWRVAHDVLVPASTDFTLERINLNVFIGLNNPSVTASFANVYIYQDAGGLPGALITSQLGVVPVSQPIVGGNFGYSIRNVELDIANVLLPGQLGVGTTYWVGISMQASDNGNVFWENSTAGLIGNAEAFSANAGATYTTQPGLEGVYTFSGSCEDLTGGGGVICVPDITGSLGQDFFVNGTTGASPVNIFFRRSVIQMVYTAAELNAMGFNGPTEIISLGWHVYNQPLYSLPGYTVKMRNTNQANMGIAFPTTGWDQVKNPYTFTPTSPPNSFPGTVNTITFDTPFQWDGVSNVGIEVCWSQVQPTWNSSGQLFVDIVGGSVPPAQNPPMRYSWTDAAGNSCGLTPATTLTYRPWITLSSQICTAADPTVLFCPDSAGPGQHWVTYTYTGDNGCTNTDSVLVTVADIPTVVLPPDTIICAEDAISITAIASGTTGPYTYEWSPSAGLDITTGPTVIASPDTSTEYTVVVTDSIGCTNFATILVEIRELPTVNIIAIPGDSICFGDSVTLVAQVFFNNVSCEEDPATLCNPTYGFGCGFPDVIDDFYTTGGLTNITNMGSGCNSTTNASADFTHLVVTVPVGGSFDFGIKAGQTEPQGFSIWIDFDQNGTLTAAEHLWSSPGSGLNEFNGTITIPTSVPCGTYTMRIRSAFVCVPAPTQGCGPTCSVFGETEDYTVVVVDQGTGSLVWNTGDTTDTITVSPSSPTQYWVMAIDDIGCTASDTIDIFVNPEIFVNAGADVDLCQGSSVMLGGAPTASGGTGNFSYQWEPVDRLDDPTIANPTTNTILSLTYTVYVTDENGCMVSDEIRVTSRELPLANAGNDVSICDGQSVVIGGIPAATGGTGPYTYNWMPAADLNDPTLANPTADPLATTIYTLIVTDIYGCEDDSIMKVIVYPLPSVTINAAGPFCANDAPVVLSAASSGGTWSGPGIVNASTGLFDPSVAGAGVHDILYSNVSFFGCVDSDTVQITVNAIPQLAITSPMNYCLNGMPVALTANISGGIWSGSGIVDQFAGLFDPAVAGLGAHAISYFYTDASGCSNTVTANVNVELGPDPAINPVAPLCSSDPAITLTGVTSGGTWSGAGITNPATGAFNPGIAGVGTHTITHTVTGLSGCIASATIDITVNGLVNFGLSAAGPFCQEATSVLLVATVGGGYWHGPGIVNPLTGEFRPAVAGPGMHTIIYSITSGNGCISVDSTQIIVNASPSSAITAVGPFCANDAAVTLSAATPSGSWSGPGITNATTGLFDPAVAGPGTHTVIYSVTDLNGCSSSSARVIKVNELPVISGTAFDVICPGDQNGKIEVRIEGGAPPYDYNWSNGANTLNIDEIAPGTYTITVTDAQGCSNEATFTVGTLSTPIAVTANITPATTPVYDNGAIDITVSGGTPPYQYEWSNGAVTQDISGVRADTFSVTIIDAYGCSQTFTFVVPAAFPISVDLNDLSRNISLYPNPTSDVININIELGGITADLDMTVFDVLGRKVYERADVINNTYNHSISMATWASGQYMIRFKIGEEVVTKKFVLTK